MTPNSPPNNANFQPILLILQFAFDISTTTLHHVWNRRDLCKPRAHENVLSGGPGRMVATHENEASHSPLKIHPNETTSAFNISRPRWRIKLARGTHFETWRSRVGAATRSRSTSTVVRPCHQCWQRAINMSWPPVMDDCPEQR